VDACLGPPNLGGVVRTFLLLTMPCLFTLDKNEINSVPMRFSSYALSLFAKYLKDDVVDYYDLDVLLSKRYQNCNNINLNEMFDSLNLKESYNYILCSCLPHRQDHSMGRNKTIDLNILILEYLRKRFPSAKIIVGGKEALKIQKNINKNIVDIIYNKNINDKCDLDNLLNGTNNHNHVDDFYTSILPENQNDLRYSYKEILDQYGFPDLRPNPNKYIFQSSIISFRGCPNKCAYCRQQSKLCIPDENELYDCILKLYDQGVNTLFFKDSSVNPSIKYAERLCNWFIKKNLNIKWSNSCCFHNTSKDFFHMLYDAGCRILCFGAESLHNDMLKYINKNTNRDEILERTKDSSEVGIWNLLNFIIGFPYDDETTVGTTIALIKKNIKHIDEITLSRFYMTAGSDFYENPHKYGLEFNKNVSIVRIPSLNKDKTLQVKPEEDPTTEFQYPAYREIDRLDFHEIEEYKTKLHNISLNYLNPYHMRVPQHLIFALYDMYNDKTIVRDMIDKYYRKVL
jgi:hypothetical protein